VANLAALAEGGPDQAYGTAAVLLDFEVESWVLSLHGYDCGYVCLYVKHILIIIIIMYGYK